jgi:hypothetical protein
VVSINIFFRAGDVHAIVRNPYRVNGGRHHGGNKMALGNVRERLALHFDAEASLTSRVKAEAYEVHIRMPYRTATSRTKQADSARRAEGAHAGASSPGASAQRARVRALATHSSPEGSRA